MKTLMHFFILFNFSQAIAKTADVIKVSQTFSINVPFQIATKIEMPSLNSKLLRVSSKANKNDSQILVIHNRPNTFANKYSVQRYWNSSKSQTQALDKNENDLGCIKNTSRLFQCSRDVLQNDKYISEALYWNAKNDLVLVRVSSLTSVSDSRRLLNKIIVEANSRLPAGLVK